MHILLILVGAVGAAAFWWYRLKVASEAASEVADAVGRVRGRIRRNRIRNQVAQSPLTAIDDPIVAAATLVVAFATEDAPLSVEREAALRGSMIELAGAEKAQEAITYAKWATEQVSDVALAVDRLAPFLRSQLDASERDEFLGILDRTLAAPGPALGSLDRYRRRLRQKLGLVIE